MCVCGLGGKHIPGRKPHNKEMMQVHDRHTAATFRGSTSEMGTTIAAHRGLDPDPAAVCHQGAASTG